MEQGGTGSGAASTGSHAIVKFYLWVGGLGLLLMAWLTPPFQVPDEPQHFYRSYQLSLGEVRSTIRNGEAGTDLPASLPELVQDFLGSTAHHLEGRRFTNQPITGTLQRLRAPLEPERVVFVDFSGSAQYAPLPYLPQALAMAAFRPLGVGPLGLLYAGRVANVLAAVAVTAWALSILRTGRLLALVIALLPMTQFVTASLSPDALTIACGLATTALLLRFIDDGRWSPKHQVGFLAHGLVLSIGKLVYLPMLLGGLAGLAGRSRWRDMRIRNAVVWQIAGVLIVVALIIGWLAFRPAGAISAPRPGVDAAAQATYLKAELSRPLRIALRSTIKEGMFLAESFLGRLGWLNLPLPTWMHIIATLALVTGLFGSRGSGLSRSQCLISSLWLLSLSAACALLVEMALYMVWTPVGNYFVQGVQGRYFTPLALMPATALAFVVGSITPKPVGRLADQLVPWLLLILSLGTHFVIATSYGLF